MTELALREQIQLDAGITNELMWQGSRITLMLNQAQNWLQGKLIKQGYKNWNDGSTVSSITAGIIEGMPTGKGSLPVDVLMDMPLESVFPQPYIAGVFEKRSWQRVETKDFNFVAQNPVTKPSTQWGIYTTDNTDIHIYPAGVFTSILLRYTRKVLDLVFDNDTVNSEIPEELQWVIVERVVMQIKSINGGEQIKQAKLAEIDKELSDKYQLDLVIKKEEADRGQTQ